MKLPSVPSSECWGPLWLSVVVSSQDLLSTTGSRPRVEHLVYSPEGHSVTFSSEQLLLSLSQALVTWRGMEVARGALHVTCAVPA